MLINDLAMNQRCVFRDVQCKMNVKKNVVAKDGHIEMIGDNTFEFISKDSVIEFTIVDKNDSKLISDNFNCHFFCLARITTTNNENDIFFIHMSFFFNMQRFGKTPVVLSNIVKEQIEKRYVRKNEKIENVLEDNFNITDGILGYFSYNTADQYYESGTDEDEADDENYELNVNGRDENAEYEIEDENAEPDNSTSKDSENSEKEVTELFNKAKQKENNKKKSIILFGKEFCLYTTIHGDGFDSKLFVEKVGKKKQNAPMMKLAEGKLEFFDHNSLLSQKVKDALQSTKGYLNLWNQYAEQEGEMLFEKVRAIGLINLNRNLTTKDVKGYHIPCNLSREAEKLLTSECSLFFSKEIPPYLDDLEMTWKDYRLLVKEADNIGYTLNKGISIKIVEKKNGGLVLDVGNGEIPDCPYVSLSIKGDELQVTRREEARQRISEGRSANPALGMILEGQMTEEFGLNSSRKKILPLSSFVKEKIFKYEPTETQKKAIEIALNTPDIAIIQGPPGTGKTTVITAIVERLNEICDKSEKTNGQVLITSFQHDAVRNVIERLRINSLPTIKFGKQEHNGEEDLTREKLIQDWCEEYIERLSSKNPELIETEQIAELNKLYTVYLAYPSDNNALAFLKCAKFLNNDSEINKKITLLIESKKTPEDNKSNELLLLIRRIRTTLSGFLDDGAENADELLYYLDKMKFNLEIQENKNVYEILNEATMLKEEPDSEFLSKLKSVKKYLLDKCCEKPVYKKETIDSEIPFIYDNLNLSVKHHENEKSAILADLLKELKTNRADVEKSLEHYLFVYSATTQQSEGLEIKIAKGINRYNKSLHPEYETVIVDEAARVSPADLMIPLAQAKRRIILVGDHRQLPHIYDEEVFETMKENGEDFNINNIKKSMFEYLLEKAKELEKIDNIQRTIVLDAQYRMHPELGEFVHKNFYSPYGEHFGSPSEDNYLQLLSKKNYPIEWYDMPNDYGPERREGTSRIRDCEADFIADKIHQFMESEDGKNLSYGVITFYSEQVKNIKAKLKLKLKNQSEKIRVGSVDAFQGMEFDVIFLSVVRSKNVSKMPLVKTEENALASPVDFKWLESDISEYESDSIEYKEWLDYKEKVGLQNYGFLISENRLCVSLSRQKKLLIVVGDTNLFCKGEWGRLANICVPGMKNLYELCKSKDVIYDGHSEGF